jgi:uptake hydrogenase large subunit
VSAARIGDVGPGALSIAVEIADARISSVRVGSTRRTSLARLFIGRPAEEAPMLAERLFSLCGVSHRVAARRAIAAARNEPTGAERVRAENVALAADRVNGTLRSNLIIALQGSSVVPDLGRIRTLGEILSRARELSASALANSSTKGPGPATMKSSIREIASLCREHALLAQYGAVVAPAEESLFDLLQKEFSRSGLETAVPDALSADDDAEILKSLRGDGESFAATPSLEDRAPETGAFARHWRKTDFSAGALAARFEARMIDLLEAIDLMEHADGQDKPGELAVAPAAREGFAAVETSRGRLYHWVRLTSAGRVKSYEIVAPTEWNFHPAGPFVGALLGAALQRRNAEREIAQLAGLLDPCVAFRVEVNEAAHA